MLRSMTAFGTARAESPLGTITVELRTVNSRFLDVNLRLPDDLRLAEIPLREHIGHVLQRGKVDVRINMTHSSGDTAQALDESHLQQIAILLGQARSLIPDTPAPTLTELIKGADSGKQDSVDPQAWSILCQQACKEALTELQANREREGARLAQMMRECAQAVSEIISQVEQQLPELLKEHQLKLATKLREALEAASPSGLSLISGPELSARIAQETSLFSLRIDVAEELSRLRSHRDELVHLLDTPHPQAEKTTGKTTTGSLGKRLDFLFQEMNREANTLGSKAGNIQMTRAAIDLKLLIEQMREQAQNIE